MTEITECPTCGSRVEVVSSDEGTSHYKPDVRYINALLERIESLEERIETERQLRERCTAQPQSSTVTCERHLGHGGDHAGRTSRGHWKFWFKDDELRDAEHFPGQDDPRIESLFAQAMDLLGGEGQIIDGTTLAGVTLVVYEARGFRRWSLQVHDGSKESYGGVIGRAGGDE